MRRTATLTFCSLMIGAASTVPAQAQNLGGFLGGMIKEAAQKSQMKKICLNQQFALNYAGYMMGYHVFDTGGGERVSIEKGNALAQEIVGRATITEWAFKGWSGNGSGGRCYMFFAMNLAPEDAAHFNNVPGWGGDVSVSLANAGGQWEVTSYEDTGSKAAVSGWLAAWRHEREGQPGGAPRLAPPLSPQQLEIKLRYARSCASHWEVSNDLFPTYNDWLDMLKERNLLYFKVPTEGYLKNGRVVSSNSNEIVCRYDIGTGDSAGMSLDKSIHDIDMRLTVVSGRPKWEVLSFPNTPIADYSPAQVDKLISQIYVDGQPFRQWNAAQSNKSAQSQPRNVMEAMMQAQGQYNTEVEDYARSQGYDVDAIKQAEVEETRKYAEPCRRNGGTWGRPMDKYGNQGRLGCYYPTGER